MVLAAPFTSITLIFPQYGLKLPIVQVPILLSKLISIDFPFFLSNGYFFKTVKQILYHMASSLKLFDSLASSL